VEVLRQSQYLRHAKYGLGVVTASNAERTTIDFDDHGEKKFVTGLMVVELLAGAAPNRPKVAAKRASKPRAAKKA
jgi:hypothetical protein